MNPRDKEYMVILSFSRECLRTLYNTVKIIDVESKTGKIKQQKNINHMPHTRVQSEDVNK